MCLPLVISLPDWRQRPILTLLFVLGALVSGALGVVFPLSLLAFLVLVQTVRVQKKAQQIALAGQKP